MKIALCQINPTVGNFNAIRESITQYYKKAIDQGAGLVVFPEMVTTGYPPQDLLWENGFINKNSKLVESIAKDSSVPIIFGFVRSVDNKLFNSAALCAKGFHHGTYDKILLPTYDVFDEDRYFTPGDSPGIWQININGNDVNVGIQICEDLWDHDYDCKVSLLQKQSGADLLINISASPYSEGQLIHRSKIILEKVDELKLPFLYCNLVGAQDELIFDGGSIAFSADGECIGQGKAFKEDILMVDLTSPKIESINFRRREENMYQALCLGVSDYFMKTRHQEAVIGLSGGIDSAVVAVIAAEAIGSENVHGVSLPSKFSSEHSLTDAQELANNLGIDYRIIPIQDAVEGLERLLYSHFLGMKRDNTEENLQSRVRGDLLMALSNKLGWLVLSTGNKTELALGYCTLYGDMSGGLAVISDLSKTDVYDLARWINKTYGDRIPQSTISKPPSAELAPDQVDPFDYEIVSHLVDEIVEDHRSPVELIANGNDQEIVNDLYYRIRKNEYKRRQAAPGLRVSAKAFGAGRRIPIVNHFEGK